MNARYRIAIASVVALVGCKQTPAPQQVTATAERFERAVLYGQCDEAWDALTEAKRLASGKEDFCRRLTHGCTAGDVSVDGAEPRGSGFWVSGSRRCSGRRSLSFTVEVVAEKGTWAVGGFSEGE
jgi:hypothetical protein